MANAVFSPLFFLLTAIHFVTLRLCTLQIRAVRYVFLGRIKDNQGGNKLLLFSLAHFFLRPSLEHYVHFVFPFAATSLLVDELTSLPVNKHVAY